MYYAPVYNLRNIIKKGKLNENVTVYLNKVLTNGAFSEELKKKIVDIMLFLDFNEEFKSFHSIELCFRNSLEAFYNFCTDKSNFNNSDFEKVIDEITKLIRGLQDIADLENKFLNFSSASPVMRKMLFRKIEAISAARASLLDTLGYNFYELLIQMLNIPTVDLAYDAIYLMAKVLEEPIKKRNAEGENPGEDELDVNKTKIILDYMLSDLRTGVHFAPRRFYCANFQQMCHENYSYNWLYHIIYNENFAGLDDEYYKKVITLSCDGSAAYFLDKLSEQENLPQGVLKSIIDYYCFILKRYLDTSLYVDYHFAAYENLSLYMATVFPSDGSISEEVFIQRLGKILDSKYPFSMATLLTCSKLTSEQFNIALEILENDKNSAENLTCVWPEYEFSEYVPIGPMEIQKYWLCKNDAKGYFANLAVSPVLLQALPDDYKYILEVVNELCEAGNRNRNALVKDPWDFDSLKLDSIYNAFAAGICSMINAKDSNYDYIYNSNISRVKLLIHKSQVLMSYGDLDDNSSLCYGLLGAFAFAGNKNSCYFDDFQFIKAVDVLVSMNYSDVPEAVKLLTNKYVPNMVDNEIDDMINYVSQNSGINADRYIAEISRNINGNQNCGSIFAGVDPSLIESLVGDPVSPRTRRRNYLGEQK